MGSQFVHAAVASGVMGLHTLVVAVQFAQEGFWSGTFGSGNGDDVGQTMVLDPLGNLYVAGSTTSADLEVIRGSLMVQNPSESAEKHGTASFGNHTARAPGMGTSINSHSQGEASQESKNDTDLFIAKISVDSGDLAWVRQFGSNANDFVTSIAYRHGVVYIAGSTFGDEFRARGSHDQTSDLFAIAFKENGDRAWASALQFGSGGNDSIQSLAFDSIDVEGRSPCPYLYASGKVGGDIFKPAIRKRNEGNVCRCQAPQSIHYILGKTHSDATDGTAPRADDQSQVVQVQKTLADNSDMFVAKIRPSDGAILHAVQVPLSNDNSADVIQARGGTLLVAVNSLPDASSDSLPTKPALLSFCAHDLAYDTVFSSEPSMNNGEEIQSMALDIDDSVYISGSAQTDDGANLSSHYVRRLSTRTKSVIWDSRMGVRGPVESRSLVSLGPLSGRVYVSGHFQGVMKSARTFQPSERVSLNGPTTAIIRTPRLLSTAVLLLAPSDGAPLATWIKPLSYPHNFESVESAALSQNENVVMAGYRSIGSSKKRDVCIGSLGLERYALRVAPRGIAQNSNSHSESESIPMTEYDFDNHNISPVVAFLVGIAVTMSLAVILAGFFSVRTWLMSRRLVSHPPGGYTCDTHYVDKFEENARIRFLDRQEVMGEDFAEARSNTSYSTLARRSRSHRTQRALSKADAFPGGSVGPI